MDVYAATPLHSNGHAPQQLEHRPQPNPPPAPPADLGARLEAELPTVLNDLIPLSFIVERVVSQAHHELANLAETLPHQPDQARKRAIVDYVLQTRRQILKLLVLVRWSSEADNVTKCMNIVGFLARQNYEFDHSVSSLTEVKGMLAGARVRNYDLPTSLSVLRTGTYTRLPAVIREGFSQPEKLDDETVLRTLAELDNVLRWRLACVERIPSKMSQYWIADGRAWFRVEGMWEASFTYGGGEAEETAEWYLLSLKFLFRVGDARGVWSSTPTGPMKEHIIELCNRELARRQPARPAGQEGSGEEKGAEKEGEKIEAQPKERDAPLVRGYNFLQRLALTYQLESLHIQALQLSSTLWSGSLWIEMNKARTELKVGYWSPAMSDPPPTNRNPAIPPPPPPTPPSIVFSIGPPSTGSAGAAPTTVSRAEARAKALERVLEGSSSISTTNVIGAEAAGGEDKHEGAEDKLRIDWSAEGLGQEIRRAVVLELDADLNLEALLLRVTTVHARDITLQLRQHLLSEFKEEDLELVASSSTSSSSALPHAATSSTSAPDLSLSPTADTLALPSIRLQLFSTHSVLCSLNPLSGKIEFKAPGEVSSAREARLRNAADKVNSAGTLPPPPTAGAAGQQSQQQQQERTPLQLQMAAAGETLVRVRASTILDEVESRAAYLGLTTTRRLPLRSIDLARFGQATRSCLFIKLVIGPPPPSPPASPPQSHYLVLVMTELGFRFALISTREGSDQVQSWLGIEEVGWLEKGAARRQTGAEGEWGQAKGKEREGEPSSAEREPYGFDVTIEDLRSLHSYCVRRIAFFQLESSLHSRRIPFRTVSSSSSSSHISSPLESSTSSTAVLAGAAETPYLVLQSSDLLKGSAAAAGVGLGMGMGMNAGGQGKGALEVQRLAWPNVALQCFVRNEVVRSTITLRLRRSSLALLSSSGGAGAGAGGEASQPPSPLAGIKNLSLEPSTGVLNMWYDGAPSAAVGVFLAAYALIARSIILAGHRKSEAVVAAGTGAGPAEAEQAKAKATTGKGKG